MSGPHPSDRTGEAIDAWEVLGLPAGASTTQAERAYRRLAKRCHPDRAAATPHEQQVAGDQMRQLNEAIAAVREGRAASQTGGWWSGHEPGPATDWFGFPLGPDEDGAEPAPVTPSAPPRREPVPCPLCGHPFSEGGALRSHLDRVHHLRMAPRRRPLLDRLDSLAWRLPAGFVVTVSGLVAVALVALVLDLAPQDGAWASLVGGESPGRYTFALLAAAGVVAVGGALELLSERHRRRVERAHHYAVVRRVLRGW